MSSKSNMLLTTLWQEIGQPISETPQLDTHVSRIDEHALVINGNPQESLLVGFGMFVMVLALIFGPLVFVDLSIDWHRALSGGTHLLIAVIVIFAYAMAIALIGLALYLLYIVLIQAAPSPWPPR